MACLKLYHSNLCWRILSSIAKWWCVAEPSLICAKLKNGSIFCSVLKKLLITLTGLERQKIEDELKAVIELIKTLKELLASPKKILGVIRGELKEISEKYGDERLTKIVKHEAKTFSLEDTIPDEESVLVLTMWGDVWRTDPGGYRRQKRGGIGAMDLETKEEDFVSIFLTASTHNDLLFFTDKGK